MIQLIADLKTPSGVLIRQLKIQIILSIIRIVFLDLILIFPFLIYSLNLGLWDIVILAISTIVLAKAFTTIGNILSTRSEIIQKYLLTHPDDNRVKEDEVLIQVTNSLPGFVFVASIVAVMILKSVLSYPLLGSLLLSGIVSSLMLDKLKSTNLFQVALGKIDVSTLSHDALSFSSFRYLKVRERIKKYGLGDYILVSLSDTTRFEVPFLNLEGSVNSQLEGEIRIIWLNDLKAFVPSMDQSYQSGSVIEAIRFQYLADEDRIVDEEVLVQDELTGTRGWRNLDAPNYQFFDYLPLDLIKSCLWTGHLNITATNNQTIAKFVCLESTIDFEAIIKQVEQVKINRLKVAASTPCGICYLPVVKGITTPCCATPYHFHHLVKWLGFREQCPNCRVVMTRSMIMSMAHDG